MPSTERGAEMQRGAGRARFLKGSPSSGRDRGSQDGRAERPVLGGCRGSMQEETRLRGAHKAAKPGLEAGGAGVCQGTGR